MDDTIEQENAFGFRLGVFKSRKEVGRQTDLYKIRLQPCQILQDFPFLVDAACTLGSSDESLLWFYAVGPDGLITQVSAKGD